MAQTVTDIEGVAEALRTAAPTLDPAEQRMALELYRMLLAARPVEPSDLAARNGMSIDDVEVALDRWPGVFRDRKGRVIGFWGLAIRGMPHRFTTSAGRITTWCALDPLIIAPLVTDRADVESNDPVSGETIRLTVTPEGVSNVGPSTAVMSMLQPSAPFGHDVVEAFCHFVHFFASRDSAARWTAEHPGTFVLSIDEAFAIATRAWPALFRDALADG